MKAQIARISHSTNLTRRGIWQVKEDEGNINGFYEIEKIEEPTTVPITNNWKIDNWIHLSPEINALGRTTAQEVEFVDGEIDDAMQEKLKAKATDIARPVVRLNPIVTDRSWINRQ